MKKLILTCAFVGLTAFNAMAKDAGQMDVNDAWAREAKEGMRAGSAFFSITNNTGQDDAIIGISSPVSMMTEIHETREEANGTYGMFKQDKVNLPMGQTITLEPGALHVMFMRLKQPLKANTELAITLEFEHAPTRNVRVPIYDRKTEMLKRGKPAISPTEANHGHHMGH